MANGAPDFDGMREIARELKEAADSGKLTAEAFQAASERAKKFAGQHEYLLEFLVKYDPRRYAEASI